MGHLVDQQCLVGLQVLNEVVDFHQFHLQELEFLFTQFGADFLVEPVDQLSAVFVILVDFGSQFAELDVHDVFDLVALVFYVLDVHVFLSNFEFLLVKFVCLHASVDLT